VHRHILLVFLGGSLWLAATACSAADRSAAPAPAPTARAAAPAAPAAPATAAPERIHLRHAYSALSTTNAPYWIADDAGYLAEEGLDAELSFIPASTTLVQALLAGEVDSGNLAGGASVQAAVNGADTVILATSVGTLYTQFVTTPAITAPEQLRGQSVGVNRFGTISDFTARLFLRAWGLDPATDVTLVQVGGQAQVVGAMQSGAIGGMVSPDLQSLELRRLGYRELADAADLGYEYPGQSLVTLRRFAADHPEAVRHYLRALARGMGRFFADKAYSVDVVQRHTGIDSVEVLGDSWELHTRRYAQRSLLTTDAAIRTVLDELGDARPPDARPEQYYDNRFVQELHDSGFLERAYASP